MSNNRAYFLNNHDCVYCCLPFFYIIARPSFVKSLPAVASLLRIRLWHMYTDVDFVKSRDFLKPFNRDIRFRCRSPCLQSFIKKLTTYKKPPYSSSTLLIAVRFVCNVTDGSASFVTSRHKQEDIQEDILKSHALIQVPWAMSLTYGIETCSGTWFRFHC